MNSPDCNQLHQADSGPGVVSFPPTSAGDLGQKTGVYSNGALLSVDKVSIVFDIDEAIRKFILAGIIALENQETFSYGTYGISRAQRGNYTAAVNVHMRGDEVSPWRPENVLLQIGPKWPNANSYGRIEFNPAKTGQGALARVQELSDHAVLGIELHKALTSACVTRLDIAADIYGPKLDDLLIEAPKKQVRAQYSKHGIAQTQYLGKKGSGVVIYDKGAEQGQGANVPHWLRIEVRKKSLGPFPDLIGFASPFTSIKIYDVLNAGLPIPKPDQRAFLDSCQKRGLNKAVHFRSSGQRTLFTKAVRSSVPEWWDPDSLWAQWPLALEQAFGIYAPAPAYAGKIQVAS